MGRSGVGSSLVALCIVLAWTVVNAQWTLLTDPSAPGPRFGAAVTYCTERDSMILFSGYDKNLADERFLPRGDLWEYSFSTNAWRNVAQINAPSARVHASFTVYPTPPASNTSIPMCTVAMVGGGTLMNNRVDSVLGMDEVWTLKLSDAYGNWTRISTTTGGPGARASHRAVYRRGQTVILGGMMYTAPTYVTFNDLWKLNLNFPDENGVVQPSTWENIPKFNTTQAWMTTRSSFAMALSLGAQPDDDRLVVFGGMTYPNGQDIEAVGDLAIYQFGTNTWAFPQGLQLKRGSHQGLISNGRFFAFGGRAIVRSSISVVFSSLLVTELGENPSAPSCTLSDGSKGLWCTAFPRREDRRPSVRYDYSMAQRGDQILVYGGLFKDPSSDLFVLNASSAIPGMVISDPDNLEGLGDLASTVYFMISILTMMVVCFLVFVISLKRHRQGHAMFVMGTAHLPNRPVGARASFVESLPLKTFHKANANAPPGQAVVQVTAVAEGEEAPAKQSESVEDDDLHGLCAICLNDYDDGESLRELPCLHFFHPDCVGQWLTNHNACPMCKQQVDPEPGHENESQASPDTNAATGVVPLNPDEESGPSQPSQPTEASASGLADAGVVEGEPTVVVVESQRPTSRLEASANV